MNNEEALLLRARALLKKYHLDGWTVDFADLSRAKSRNYFTGDMSFGARGICRFFDANILVDLSLVNHRNKFLQVVKHEVAHALAGPGAGHRSKWLRIARRVGCSPRSLEIYR